MKRMQSTKLKTNTLTQLLAVGSVAIASVATISAAPAGAVTFTSGDLNFRGVTSNFATSVNPIPGNSFGVNFTPDPVNSVSLVTGSFSPTFTTSTNLAAPTSSTFSYFSPSTYNLDSNLVFNFTNGVSFTLLQNSKFTNTPIFNNVNVLTGYGLQLADNAGSFFTSGTDISNIPTLAFSFNDTGLASGGQFIASASPTAVPEPFTIIGTIVGGTAAFRMRKKLAAANKK
jgi:hypothetical protein